jgi:hypothetical protein
MPVKRRPKLRSLGRVRRLRNRDDWEALLKKKSLVLVHFSAVRILGDCTAGIGSNLFVAAKASEAHFFIKCGANLH